MKRVQSFVVKIVWLALYRVYALTVSYLVDWGLLILITLKVFEVVF